MKKLLTVLLLTICTTQIHALKLSKYLFNDSIADNEEIYLELPLLDFPYQKTAIDLKGNFFKSYANQSMATSLALTQDLFDGSHYAFRQIFKNNPLVGRLVSYAFDFLASYLPLGSGWVHEEYHRAIMTLRGVDSFDEILLFPIGASTVSVSHETDEAMTILHDRYPSDFLRLNTAGAEGETHWIQETQRKDFFYHRTLYHEFGYIFNIIGNTSYVNACQEKETDMNVKEMMEKEKDIENHDFTGMDFSAWAFELFHPGNRYVERGIHPSGKGIHRYIMYDQIGDEGLAYLKKESRLELLNFVSPMILGIDRFKLFTTKKGDWYGNFSLRHYMNNFGDDISLDLLLESPDWKFFVTPHLFSNWKHSFPGLEAGFVDRHFFGDHLKMNASFQIWNQPEDFYASSGKLGGSLSFDAIMSFGRLEPYVSACAKTAGWQAGNVYLDDNFSWRLGLRWKLNGK